MGTLSTIIVQRCEVDYDVVLRSSLVYTVVFLIIAPEK